MILNLMLNRLRYIRHIEPRIGAHIYKCKSVQGMFTYR